MSEQTQNTNQMVVIGLAVVAVLLVAIVGILIYQQSTAVPAPTPVGTQGNTGMGGVTDATGGGMSAPAGMGSSAPTEFDAATATKVPSGTTPLEFVTAYHEAVAAGKFEEAYKMLPVDKQASYGNAEAYAEQVKAYGITGFEIGEPVEEGDTFSVAATQVTPQMPISYTWTFKKVDDTWFCASRTMGGQ